MIQDVCSQLVSKSVSCCLVTRSCPTLCDPTDHSLLGSSVHGISQARILEYVAIFSFQGIFLHWQVYFFFFFFTGGPPGKSIKIGESNSKD